MIGLFYVSQHQLSVYYNQYYLIHKYEWMINWTLSYDDHANLVLHILLQETHTISYTLKQTHTLYFNQIVLLRFRGEEKSENFNVRQKSHEETDFVLKMSIKYLWEILITYTNDYDDECIENSTSSD